MTEYRRIIIGKKYKEIQVPSESIYNLISRSTGTSPIRRQSPRYQSKYSNMTKKFYESLKKSHETMGYAKTPLKSSTEYLKKQSREDVKIENKRRSCLDEDNKKPPVPKREDGPPILHEKRNFVELNRLVALRKPALRPARKLAYTRRGDSFFLEFSGLVPKFVRKEEFGKTPRYLVQSKENLLYSKEMHQKLASESKLIRMTDEERSDLLEGLRANWEQLNNKYMTLPLVIDTKILKNKKLELERKLDLLEHDIYFLEKNEDNDIYILPQ